MVDASTWIAAESGLIDGLFDSIEFYGGFCGFEPMILIEGCDRSPMIFDVTWLNEEGFL